MQKSERVHGIRAGGGSKKKKGAKFGSRIVDPRIVDPRMVDPRMVDPKES